LLTLLRNPTFTLFFLGNAISLIGFGLNLISISWLVLEETGSELALGKIMAAATIPGVLLALFAGVIIDRMNRKWLMVILDIVRMVIIIVFLSTLLLNSFTMMSLFIMVFLMGIGNSLFWPTAQAFVQQLVEPDEYFNANALLSASYQTGSILGAGLGGLVVHYFGVNTALAINALTYLVSGILISLAPFSYQKRSGNTEKIISALMKGFRFFQQNIGVLLLGLTTILADVAIWGAMSVITITMSRDIYLAGSWGYGIMEGLYGIGALLSTIVAGIGSTILGKHRFLLVCYIISAIMAWLSPGFSHVVLAALAYLFMGLHNNSARICIRTTFMEQVPNEIMGRVQTILGVYTRVAVITSAIIAGWIVENYSVQTGMNFTSIHFILAAAGIILVLLIPKYRPIIVSRTGSAV
tara:strand:+ start:21848 stop:23080 length:1233 start_codon:yes stop_codon:yes gene_type:complete